MKVSQPTPDELLLSDFPLLAGGFCALVFVGSALVCLPMALTSPIRISGLLSSCMAVLLSGFGVICFLKKTVIHMDKRTGKLTWKRWGALGVRRGEIALSEIKDIAVEVLTGGSLGRPGARQTYRVSLLTAAGSWPLTEYYSSTRTKCENVQALLRDFLGLSSQLSPDRSRTPA